jgi:hypothetical protein
MNVVLIIDINPKFATVLQQFGISPADYERMSLEELASLEVEK